MTKMLQVRNVPRGSTGVIAGAHRNLSVLSVTRAQMTETIQKRTMMSGSGHPASSK